MSRTRYINGIFHTMESPEDCHETMTVEGDTIVAFDEPVGASGAQEVDLGGAHVFPAFIDAHLHLLDTVGLAGISTQLCHFAGDHVEPGNLAGIGALVRKAAAASNNKLLVFSNYITAGIEEGRLPNAQELDAWVGEGREAWVLNIDGHSSSCSTALLKALGLAEAAPSGILTGENHDANLGLITQHITSVITPALLGTGIAEFCDQCASFGIGTLCALEGTDDSEKDTLTVLLARLAQRFPLDVRLYPQYMDEAKLAKVLPFMARPRVGGCMKWELDGSIGSRTAAFREPFADGSQGDLYFDTSELQKYIQDFDSRGFEISAHAIGEQAINQLVSIYEGLPAGQEMRHRIDHCEFPHPDDIERLVALKPFITVQPGYAWIDKHYLHGYEQWLNPQQLGQQVPLKTLTEAGVVLCGSSDSPVQSVDPFVQMRGMREFYVEDQSLSAYEALKTYTVNGGLMLGEKKGLLRVGYQADFFTIGVDLLEAEPGELDGLKAQQLFVRGKPYQSLPKGMRGILACLHGPKRAL